MVMDGYALLKGRETDILFRMLDCFRPTRKFMYFRCEYNKTDRLLDSQSTVMYKMAVDIRKGRGLLAPQAFTLDNLLSTDTSQSSPQSPGSLDGLLFIPQLRESLGHIAGILFPHTRRFRFGIGITGLPASYPTVRSATPSRRRLGTVTGNRHHRGPPATAFLCPFL